MILAFAVDALAHLLATTGMHDWQVEELRAHRSSPETPWIVAATCRVANTWCGPA
ncbi:MAG: hypothetical protein LC792_06535 [Actinobacteria bacterium]|nr:hypothetical protein [Actinomycetota bacterium]